MESNRNAANMLEASIDGELMAGPKGEWDGGIQNAFKHAFWSAKNAQTIGVDKAIEVGNNHEESETGAFTDADKSNNSVGIEIGGKVDKQTSNGDILSLILDAGLQGKLTVVTKGKKEGEFNTSKVNLSGKKYASQVKMIQQLIFDMKKADFYQMTSQVD